MSRIRTIVIGLLLALLISTVFIGGVISCFNPQPEPPGLWDSEVYGEVTFSQLEWMYTPERALYPYSNVGEVKFTFLEGALGLLRDGAWINMVIDTTAARGTYQWAVQNLYLTYEDEDYLLASNPSVQFSLGLDNETPIDELEAAVFLSDEPFEEEPEADELSTYEVSHKPYLAGGWDQDFFGEDSSGGSALSDIPWDISSYVGTTFEPVSTACIGAPWGGPWDWHDIEEPVMGCFPGAATRSIAYLRLINGWWDIPEGQELYDILYVMTGTNGNGCHNFHAGKQAFFEEYISEEYHVNVSDQRLMNINFNPSDPDVWPYGWESLIQQVQTALNNDCDVEMGIGWTGGGCHGVMVTCVTLHMGGSTTITYLDDHSQGNAGGGDSVTVISTNNIGEFNAGHVGGFVIECPQS
jgi:hypothetical protein